MVTRRPKSVTSVGAASGSMGPPMSVIERGCASGRAAARRAAATSTRGAGWQTATTWRSGPSASMKPWTCRAKSSTSKRPALTGMSRALRQSVMNTSQSGRSEITVLRRSVA
jgi:hypothetical protein